LALATFSANFFSIHSILTSSKSSTRSVPPPFAPVTNPSVNVKNVLEPRLPSARAPVPEGVVLALIDQVLQRLFGRALAAPPERPQHLGDLLQGRGLGFALGYDAGDEVDDGVDGGARGEKEQENVLVDEVIILYYPCQG